MKQVKAALVGYGWWGRKIASLVASAGEGIAIEVVVEPGDSAHADAAAAGFRTVASLDEALAMPAVDAVILATPHRFHTAQVRAAAEAGKHVFCEKPLALTGDEAAASADLCTARGLVLAIGHERRFEPAVAALLADAAAGRLGRLMQIEANFSHDKFVGLAADNWRLDKASAPLAGMTATGIHLTDLAIALLGAPASVHAYCAQLASGIPQGDTLGAHITFRDGGTAYVAASLGYPFVSRFALYGSKGWVEIRDKSHVEAPTGWLVLRSGEGGATVVEEVPPAEAVIANLETFAAAIRGERTYPIPTADMVENTRLLEAMMRSVETGDAVRIGAH